MSFLVVHGVAPAGVLVLHLRRQRRLQAEHADARQRAIAGGLAGRGDHAGVRLRAARHRHPQQPPGVIIAGRFGGMGLIRKAAEQGRQAMDAIRTRMGQDFDHGVVIVRAGGLLTTQLPEQIGNLFDTEFGTG